MLKDKTRKLSGKQRLSFPKGKSKTQTTTWIAGITRDSET